MAKLSTLLDQIDSGTIVLPEFQRGYVWNREQVRGLMRSLYRGYPVGSLLLWETAAPDRPTRCHEGRAPHDNSPMRGYLRHRRGGMSVPPLGGALLGRRKRSGVGDATLHPDARARAQGDATRRVR